MGFEEESELNTINYEGEDGPLPFEIRPIPLEPKSQSRETRGCRGSW